MAITIVGVGTVDSASTPRVEAKIDQVTGGVQALQVFTPAGQTAVVRWYDAGGTPHTLNGGTPIPGGSNPYSENVSAADIPSAPRIEMDLP